MEIGSSEQGSAQIASPAVTDLVSFLPDKESLALFPSRRLGKTLSRYVRRELVWPTLFALGVLTSLILTKDLLSFSDLIINRGFGIAAVASIALYEFIPLVSLTLPFALLLGTLIALGRLRADREILSIEAAGVSSRQLARPVAVVAAFATAIGLLLSLFAAPWAHRSLGTALKEMAEANPGIFLLPGVVNEFNDVKLAAREVSARGDQLRGVLLWLPNVGHTIFAERGRLEPQGDGSAQLLLQDVEMLTRPGRETATMRFGTFSTVLRRDPEPMQKKQQRLAGLSTGELIALTQAEGEAAAPLRSALTELHRRFSMPIACLVLGVIAVPLALRARRASRATGAVMGLLAIVVYYSLVQLGEGLIQWAVVSIGCGVWLPNVVVGTSALGLLLPEKIRLAWQEQVSDQGRSVQRRRVREIASPRPQHYILQRYAIRQFTSLLFVSFTLLLAGYLIVDVLERLDWFARYQAAGLVALRFYSARVPLLASRVIPVALLLATALTVSLLSRHKELIAMRACGISATRTLVSLLLVCGLVAPVYFLLNEAVVPRTNAWADHLKQTEIKNRDPETTPMHMAIWYSSGRQVYQATQLDPKLGEAQGVAIYELGDNGLPVSRTDAASARYIGNGLWELTDPVRIEVSDQGLREIPANSVVRLGEPPSTDVDTMHLSTWQLAHEIHSAEEHGYAATKYRVDLHVKLASPLACVLLPTVALFFAVGGPPFPPPALTFLVSIGLGVGYILLTGVSASLGYGGFIPPIAAGWVPPFLLIALASITATRTQG